VQLINVFPFTNINNCNFAFFAWSLTLREKYRLRVFENMLLSRIFGPKRDNVMREWIKLHIEELSDLYSSPGIVWVVK
jgi:hypothetical protein